MAIINLYNTDCMEFMRNVPDKHYDLAIVDPPYGIGASKGMWGGSNLAKVTNYGKKDWDKEAPPKLYFDELIRVSKNQIIWGGNYFTLTPSSCWLVWDKLNSAGFADCELAWTSFNTAVRKFQFRWNGMLQGDMKNKEVRIHPTQKPIALYKWLLKNYAKQGDKILDTHAGSFSIGIACHEMGFDLDATEIDKDYYEAALKRYNAHISQQRLFNPNELAA